MAAEDHGGGGNSHSPSQANGMDWLFQAFYVPLPSYGTLQYAMADVRSYIDDSVKFLQLYFNNGFDWTAVPEESDFLEYQNFERDGDFSHLDIHMHYSNNYLDEGEEEGVDGPWGTYGPSRSTASSFSAVENNDILLFSPSPRNSGERMTGLLAETQRAQRRGRASHGRRGISGSKDGGSKRPSMTIVDRLLGRVSKRDEDSSGSSNVISSGSGVLGRSGHFRRGSASSSSSSDAGDESERFLDADTEDGEHVELLRFK